jgi:hypothetical protein
MSMQSSGTGAEMTRYSVYVIGSGYHFIRAIALECTDDSAAIESAKQLADGYDVELWHDGRYVAKLQNSQT